VSTSFGQQLEIGVPEIDAQHREMFGTLATLEAALARADEAAATVALNLLSRYALEHFETEERWMRRTSYPRLREHLSQHDDFVARLVAITNERADGGPCPHLIQRIQNALSWLRDHIENEDQLLARLNAPQLCGSMATH
jgi:hemerythrin